MIILELEPKEALLLHCIFCRNVAGMQGNTPLAIAMNMSVRNIALKLGIEGLNKFTAKMDKASEEINLTPEQLSELGVMPPVSFEEAESNPFGGISETRTNPKVS